jgi:hypothetical protein
MSLVECLTLLEELNDGDKMISTVFKDRFLRSISDINPDKELIITAINKFKLNSSNLVLFIQYWSVFEFLKHGFSATESSLGDLLGGMKTFRNELVNLIGEEGYVSSEKLIVIVDSIIEGSGKDHQSYWMQVRGTLKNGDRVSLADLSKGVFIWVQNFVKESSQVIRDKPTYRAAKSSPLVKSPLSSLRDLKKEFDQPSKPSAPSTVSSSSATPSTTVERPTPSPAQDSAHLELENLSLKEQVKTLSTQVAALSAELMTEKTSNKENKVSLLEYSSKFDSERNRLHQEISDLKSQLLTMESLKLDCELEIRKLKADFSRQSVPSTQPSLPPNVPYRPPTLPVSRSSESVFSSVSTAQQSGIAIGGADFLTRRRKSKRKSEDHSGTCAQQ